MSSYTDREVYRSLVSAPDLHNYRVIIKETDLSIMTDMDLGVLAYDLTLQHRLALESYLKENPEFGRTLRPLGCESYAPPIVRKMSRASKATGVGPMAAVAGALAECVGLELLKRSSTVIVENGGDLFLRSPLERIVAIYAGKGPGEASLGLKIRSSVTPLGICTSSGIIGPSLSQGRTRVATVIASSASLADAAATALGNRVRSTKDIKRALEKLSEIDNIMGALVIIGQTLGALGEIDLVNL